MFSIFRGQELVTAYQNLRLKKRFQLSGYLRVILAATLAFVICALPTDVFGIEGLNSVEQRVIAMFFFAAIMWFTEAIPSWCTSVLIIVVMLFTISSGGVTPLITDAEGVKYANLIPYKDIMHCFADPTIMLFIGGFILAIGLSKAKLDVFLAKWMLKPFGTQSRFVLLGFIVVTAVFSAFVSNTATAAMMIAFLAPVLKSLPADGKGRIALALAIPLGANIGGIATPIGTPPNTIALGYLSETLGITVGFGEWMAKMIPYVLIMLLLGWVLLLIMFPFKQKNIKLEIDGEFEHNSQTWTVILTFLATVILWCWPKNVYDLGLNSYIIALIPMATFTFTGLLTKKDLEQINWSVLWMVAGGFALGVALNGSGLSKHLVDSIPFAEWSVLLVMAIAGLVCYGFSNFISHSAAASLLVPVLGVVAGAMVTASGNDAIASRMLICVAITSSVAMILPISTPPNAIAHSTGMFEQKDMIKVGIIVGVLGLVLGFGWMFLVF